MARSISSSSSSGDGRLLSQQHPRLLRKKQAACARRQSLPARTDKASRLRTHSETASLGTRTPPVHAPMPS